MVIRIRHIILFLTLLLASSTPNEAWGKITYHILSLPMTTYQRDGNNNAEGNNVYLYQKNVRVEVLRVVSTDLHVELPFEYKSPLVTTYHYYASNKVTRSASPEQLYGYNNTKYYFYTINDSKDNKDVSENQLTEGDACSDNIDIYVTYEYDPTNSPIDLGVDLLDPNSGSHKEYNIHLKDRMVVLNQTRQNRPGAVADGYYTPQNLVNDEFSWIVAAGLNNSAGWRHFVFKFGGNDPYNVTIFTAFDKPYTFRGTGQSDFYSTFNTDKDKYFQKNVYKEYRGSSFFSLMKSEISGSMWLSSEAHTQWLEGGSPDHANPKTVPGFFKGPNDNKSTYYEMSPIFNSFAILNHKSGDGSWAFAGSKMNHGTTTWQPRASDGQIQYMDYNTNTGGKDINVVYKAEASACKVDVYEVRKYTFRVQTPFRNSVDAVMKWSDYSNSETISEEMIPDELKRKYVHFTGFKIDTNGDGTPDEAVTTFEAAQAGSKDDSGRPIIYVQYEVAGAPFTAITATNETTSYTTATWYELTDAASSGGNKIKWDATNSVYKNNGASGVYEKESEFAFIGDPYELHIINRKLTVDALANRYVGSPSRTTGSDLTNDADVSDGFKWEIPDDETIGSFTLREFGSTNAYWNWDASSGGNNIQYSTSASTRIKVMEIGKLNYTFNVVDLAGNVAIQATEAMTPFTTLTGYANIPAVIRSPFLSDETVTFWSAYNNDGTGRKNLTTGVSNLSGALTELPGTASNIYVAYTTTNLSNKNIQLLYSQEFNVKLNGEYIYWNSSDNKILSNASPTTDELESNAYLWHLRGRDPYAMRIDNKGASIATFSDPVSTTTAYFYDTNGSGDYTSSSPESVADGMFVRVADGTWGYDKALEFVNNRDNASRFIAMMSNNVGVYEVMAATGTDDYYHIGRASNAGAETKVYSTATYAHGADQLRFELAGTTVVTYHLIDKSGNELFTNEITSKNPRMALPADYVSPLVEEYYYYPTRAQAETNSADGRITEIADDKQEDGTGGPDYTVYVRYKTKEDFGFGTNYPRLLQFLQPFAAGYLLEDGADKLTDSKIQAVYPYCNGDGNLNIYGEPMKEEQMDGGSSTRPRWIWFFESENSDPYHVKIHSKSTISFGGGSHTTYIHTEAVHFNQDDNAQQKRIVTGGHFPGISGVPATEYMILGVTGRYKLVTTEKIAADLNGDGDTGDEDENERRTVTSFEQYWKTYNMLKQHVLGINCDPKEENEDPYKDEYSTVRTTWVIPDELRGTLKTRLNALTIGGDNWHSYDAIANAVRWNGYNDKGTRNTKLVEPLEHWFQTFYMGDGTFNIEDADIPPVLVLLDRHGWEIMRKPLPTGSNDPARDEKLAALRAFDSPMVKEYKFYSNATKASNCHKYTLRMQNGAERDPIKLNGVQFTSTSLADLPPLTASGVMSGGAINDHFVTYTVKEEYEKSYSYSYDESTKEETFTASKFLFLQNAQYAQENGAVIDGKNVPASGLSAMIISPDATADSNTDGTIDDKNLWYVQPNLEIDEEMDIPWATKAGNTSEPKTKEETKAAYKDKTGFDPYNIQLKNADTGKFLTINMTQSELVGGAYTGDYTGRSLSVTLADQNTTPVVSTAESYDHTHLHMTNQTFMAVQDENGNMQLMPRFDHAHRVNAFTTLAAPLTEEAGDQSGAQTTQLVRPLVFDYRIIDNNGNTAMRYRTGGEFYPSMPEHFKSPLAKDFKYYKTLEDANSDGVYELATLADEITSSFAAADIQNSSTIYIRYSYDEDFDTDNNNILQGRWMTIKLGGKDVQAEGTVVASVDAALSGTGVSLYTGEKPTEESTPKLSESKQWHWKFLASPSVATSDYYEAPDPYAVKIYNREANKDDNPTANPNKMGTAIKVGGKERFVLLAHPDGDYALAAASDSYTSYSFLDGTHMADPSTTAASVVVDDSFSPAATYNIADGERLEFFNDILLHFTYKVITNEGLLAASQTQDESTAQSNDFKPFLPEDIQTPLLNMDDYLYYGTSSESEGVYTVDPSSQLNTLYGLYDDMVYVRYNTYNELKSAYKVPNVKGTDGTHVTRGSGSNDTSLGLHGNLLYNIIWYNDEMMKNSEGGNAVESESDRDLQATAKFEWQLEGNDPYAIKIKSIGASDNENSKYIHESATLGTCDLSTTPTTFMILNRDGYDYGVLAKTGSPVIGSSASMLSGHGHELTTSDPNHFIIFALATYKVIYHLMIKTTNDPVVIPYNGVLTNNIYDPDYKILDGSTQRDLTSGGGHTYQLGTNIHSILTSDGKVIGDSLYCVDAGCISLGDVLKVPDELYRPNVVYRYFIEGVYNATGTAVDEAMNNEYKGCERTTMGEDAGLLGKTVLVNIIYTFDGDLGTNQGEGFVMDVADNQWYTFETNDTYLAHYTNAWGLQSMAGRATRYTNDYLWAPLGDPYGFKMYNRYMLKNSNQPNYVMTTPDLTPGRRLMMGEPGVTDKPAGAGEGTIPSGNEVYELLPSEVDGYFNVHPVANTDNTLFVKKGTDDFAELSTTPTPWTFGLNETLFEPYYERAGYVGGLTDSGKTKYETAATETDLFTKLIEMRKVVYDDDNIVPYAPGYYRLHNQPGVSGISPVRYASGYLHKTELTGDGTHTTDAIPMHFYSKKGVNTTFGGEGGLGTGFTETNATRGPIPVPATEYDPSTIFYLSGAAVNAPAIPTSTLSTQGLYVKGKQTNDDHGDATMTSTLGGEGETTIFTLMDIGAGVFLIHDGSVPESRKYLHFDQRSSIYDLKFYHNSPTDDAKWCIEPANMQGLMVTTNSGGDGYYYTTFYAPFDVELPADDGTKTYNAYVCTTWDTELLHPVKVPANGTHAEGKFVPAETPVIIRTNDNVGNLKLTLPNSSPTTKLSSNIFSGEYLEQLLADEITESDKVYAFGLPITGYGLDTSTGSTNGNITDVVNKAQADTGVGFYLNANPNKELSEETGLWLPNNRYVLHNKIYYRAPSGSGASQRRMVMEYVPVDFDGENMEEEEEGTMKSQREGDGRVYDLQGRCVATEQQLKDGTWRDRLSAGIYIVNGRKVRIR